MSDPESSLKVKLFQVHHAIADLVLRMADHDFPNWVKNKLRHGTAQIRRRNWGKLTSRANYLALPSSYYRAIKTSKSSPCLLYRLQKMREMASFLMLQVTPQAA